MVAERVKMSLTEEHFGEYNDVVVLALCSQMRAFIAPVDVFEGEGAD